MPLKLEDLSIEQKIGMVLCARRFTEEDMEFILELVKNHALGSVQPQASHPEIAKKILEVADYPIIIVNDTEQGFPTTNLPKVSLNALAATNDPAYCRAYAKGVVRDAREAGFNGTWGPIVDVLMGNGPCKVGRCFSDDWETVSKLAEEIAMIYKQNHYFSCGKHYPGSTGLEIDTHMREGYSDLTKEELINQNLLPYRYLMEKGLLPTVMVEHSVFQKIDPDYPASLSQKVIAIIREMGFDGVMFTDSFAMMGILQKFGEENVYGMAIAAGNDIVLPNYRTSVKECYELLMKNYQGGAFAEDRLNEAVRRVLALQEFVGTKPENPTEFTKEDQMLLESVAKDCITAVTDTGVSPALDTKNKEKLFVVMTNQEFVEEETPEIDLYTWYYPHKIARKIKENFPEATLTFIPEFSNHRDHDRVLNQATKFQEVVVVTYCETAAYMGTDGLTRRAEAWINSLQHSGKISAIVHFGNPYALENIAHIPRRIFGYTLRDSQEYAIDVLAGKLEAKGKIPFKVQLP